MRTSRCILYTALGTGLCLLYVFLQTEVVKLGYQITASQKVLEASLDRNKTLEYNLSTLESPLNIDKNLFLKGDGYEMAKDYKLVKVGPASGEAAAPETAVAKAPAWKRFALQVLFGSRQAQAQTIK